MKTKYSIVKVFLLGLGLLLDATNVAAQPINDHCQNAIWLNNIQQNCSIVGAFSNQNAQGTIPTSNNCPTNQSAVWFRFKAIATDLSLTVIGNILGDTPGGTLNQPEISLYLAEEDCEYQIFRSIECQSGTTNNIAELYQGGLIPGQSYLIRIQGKDQEEGTFQLCINNYFAPAEPGGDLVVASVLCDKSSFIVQKVEGTGADNHEAEGTCLDISNSFSSEQNSTWFTWIAANNGLLTFTLKPLNPTDDLDFIIFELPNGLNNPIGKNPVRCMATACLGPTGLSLEAVEDMEDLDCHEGEDGFVRALDMQEGLAYGLLINNFTSTGNGFSIEFGGDGRFLGPTPQIEVTNISSNNIACVDASLSFSGHSSSFPSGEITKYEWIFGEGANLGKAEGPGPHNVTYNTLGEKIITLIITTNLGCKISTSKTFIVESCCTESNKINITGSIHPITCNGQNNGAIDLNVSSNSPILSFEWSNLATTEDISGLSKGNYTVTITNQAKCLITETYKVDAIPPLAVNPTVIHPTCVDSRNGAIELAVKDGSPPYSFDFGQGVTSINSLKDIPAGIYPITVTDDAGCTEEIAIQLVAKHLKLEVDLSTTPPLCHGQNNGSIEVSVSNGQPNYQYDWNDGNGYVNSNYKDNIPAGNYSLKVIDHNLCKDTFNIALIQPPPLELNLETKHASCEGNDGVISTFVNGGTGNYQYAWNNGKQTAQLMNLTAGSYEVSILDENQCSIISNTSIESSLFEGFFLATEDAKCYNQASGSITLTSNQEAHDLEISIDGLDFQNQPTIANLMAGEYIVTVKNQSACIENKTIIIGEPQSLELTLDTLNPSCEGNGGEIIATVNGGTGNYQYRWSNGADSEYLTDLTANHYEVSIYDENQCVIYGKANLKSPMLDDFSLVTEDAKCHNQASGSILLMPSQEAHNMEISIDGILFQNQPTITNLVAGDYTVTIRNNADCAENRTVSINQPTPLTVAIGEDLNIALGASIHLKADIRGEEESLIYKWSNQAYLDCNDCANPMAKPDKTMPFSLTVTNENECTASDTLLVHVEPNRNIYIPNVFTPNEDGKNDRFTAFSGATAQNIMELSVFDQWGNRLYQAINLPINNENFGWDGSANGQSMQNGTYVYFIRIQFINNEEAVYSGDITLIR